MKRRDQDTRRLHPRLRVYANSDDQVNALRSELSTAVASILTPAQAPQVQSLADSDLGEAQRCQHALLRSVVPEHGLKVKKSKKLSAQPPAKHAFVNVFVQFLPEQQGALGQAQAKARDAMLEAMQQAATSKAAHEVRGAILPRRNFVVATVPVTMLDTLKKNKAVAASGNTRSRPWSWDRGDSEHRQSGARCGHSAQATNRPIGADHEYEDSQCPLASSRA